MRNKSIKLSILPLLLVAAESHASGCYVDHFSGEIICSGNTATVSSGGALPTVIQNDFAVAMDVAEPLAETTLLPSESGAVPAQAGVGLECGWASSRGNGDTSVCTLPLSYTIHNEIDPRRRLVFKVPVTWVDSDNPLSPGQTYHVGFGASYTYPLATRWYVTPGVNYTYADEGDFGQKADLVSASLASAYFYKDRGFDFGIGNMIGYAMTVNETGGHPAYYYSTLRNGLMVSKAGSLFGRKVYWEGAVVDTLYFGDQLFTDHQLEVSLTVGDKRSYKISGGGYRLGLTLFDAGDTDGGKLTFGYWF